MSKPGQEGENVPQGSYKIIVVERAQILRGLAVLKAKLDMARACFDGRTKLETPDRLAAAEAAMLGLTEFLAVIDPTDSDGHQAVVLNAAQGLHDLRVGNQTPDWLQPKKKKTRSRDASEKWMCRGTAVIVYAWLQANGVPKEKALSGIHKVLKEHNLDPPNTRGIYGWREQIEEGRAPKSVVDHYRRQLTAGRRYGSPAEAEKELLRFLSDNLAYHGHPAGDSKKAPTDKWNDGTALSQRDT